MAETESQIQQCVRKFIKEAYELEVLEANPASIDRQKLTDEDMKKIRDFLLERMTASDMSAFRKRLRRDSVLRATLERVRQERPNLIKLAKRRRAQPTAKA